MAHDNTLGNLTVDKITSILQLTYDAEDRLESEPSTRRTPFDNARIEEREL